ncbi:MAG: class I tRNA ligase family protein [Rhizomicrobium sp.]
MDVLARHLRRTGQRVASGLTTDGFENHVLVRAAAEGSDPSELAHRYYRRIKDDLASIGIRFDLFDDPAHLENLDRFDGVKNSLVRGLEQGSQVVLRSGMLPVDDALPEEAAVEERFCIGGWFAARCPRCGSAAGSFFCEACGHHFEPAEALEPASRRGKVVSWRRDESFHVQLATDGALARLWRDMKIEEPFAGIAQRYVDLAGQAMRLTVPGRHGLDWRAPGLVTNQICFSYSSLLYAHHLYCGDRIGDLNGWPNPFAAGDDAILIGATGIDNTIPMLVGVSGCALAQAAFRPFDRVYFNHFLSLDGEKFSTSRGHVIWAGDISAHGALNVDLLRMYLSEICPEDGETDFRISRLIARHNVLFGSIQPKVATCTATLGLVRDRQMLFDESLLERLERLYEQQCAALSIDRLRVSYASAAVSDWLGETPNLASAESAYTWLKGLALLAAPLMPDLSQAVWKWLGHEDGVLAEEFLERPAIGRLPPPKLAGRILSSSDLDACMPRQRAA